MTAPEASSAASGSLSGTGTQRPEATQMFREAAESAASVERQLARNQAALRDLGKLLRDRPPRALVTCARGSSDHAATFARYLVETRLGLLTASLSPSISSVYGMQQDLRDCVFIAISQSGQSPDLLAAAAAARTAGATIVALVNVESSPLAQAADHVVPLCAGAETSVAATKSFIASLAACVQLVANWTDDRALCDELARTPERLAHAWNLDWSAAITRLESVDRLFVLGRGLGLGVAQESALKLKETCGIHAEAFSTAEVRHGPMALLGSKVPALIFAQNDATLPGQQALARDIAQSGVPVLFAGDAPAGATSLPTLASPPEIAPLLFAQSFYRTANAISIARGFDPDRPPRLNKVTETL